MNPAEVYLTAVGQPAENISADTISWTISRSLRQPNLGINARK
jgi:hypothetical protein